MHIDNLSVENSTLCTQLPVTLAVPNLIHHTKGMGFFHTAAQSHATAQQAYRKHRHVRAKHTQRQRTFLHHMQRILVALCAAAAVWCFLQALGALIPTQTMLVASHAIPRGSQLSKQDVRSVSIRSTSSMAHLITIHEAVGSIAQIDIAADTPLSRTLISNAPLPPQSHTVIEIPIASSRQYAIPGQYISLVTVNTTCEEDMVQSTIEQDTQHNPSQSTENTENTENTEKIEPSESVGLTDSDNQTRVCTIVPKALVVTSEANNSSNTQSTFTTNTSGENKQTISLSLPPEEALRCLQLVAQGSPLLVLQA